MKLFTQKHIVILDFDDIKNPLLGAGQARSTFEIGRRLVEKGNKVTVICSRFPGYKDRTEKGIIYKHIGIATSNIRLNNIVYILSLPLIVRKLKATIIVECFTAPISTMFTPLFTSLPVVAKATSFEAERFSQRYHLPFSLVESIGAKLYRYFIPTSTLHQTKMKKLNTRVDMKKINEGVNKEYFSIVPATPKHILYIGRLDIDQKGLDMLLNAYALISHKIQQPLLIGGHGPDKEKVITLIKALGLEKKVKVVGSLYGKKKARLLKHASAVVMPSRNEGFSILTLESLAAGIPVVMFAIPGLDWVSTKLLRKSTCFSVEQYASLLYSYATKKRTKTQYMQYKQFAKQYSWDTIVNDYEMFFDEIIEKYQSPSRSISTIEFIKGKVWTLIDRYLPSNKNSVSLKIPHLKFVKRLKPASEKLASRTALYKDIHNKKYVVRSMNYRFETLEYHQLKNEKNIFALLSKITNEKKHVLGISFPKIIWERDDSNTYTLVREYSEGTFLKDSSGKEKINTLRVCLKDFKKLTRYMSRDQISHISKRSPYLMIVLFPLYVIRALLKDPQLLAVSMQLSYIFYTNAFRQLIKKPSYVLAHRDLHSENIVIQKHKISIIDPEITLLAEEQTDLAIVARYYIDEIGTYGVLSLLDEFVKEDSQKEQFLRLTIFYAFQMLAFVPKKHYQYPMAQRYIQQLKENIIPYLTGSDMSLSNPLAFITDSIRTAQKI